MVRFLISRFVQSVLVVVLVYTATFWLLMAAPGDPFIGEKTPPQEVRTAIAKAYGLPYLALPPEQRAQLSGWQRFWLMCPGYTEYLWRFASGRNPTIEYENWSVNEIIGASLPVSVALGALALLIAMWLGVAAGVAGALTKGRWPDLSLTIVTLFGVSLPTFVIATLLLTLFAVVVPILPAGGWGTLRQLVLPAITLSLFYLAYIARLTRASVLDVLSADYVRTAWAKGLPGRRVIGSHVLRNAGLPVLSYVGPAAAMILTGAFVVEKVFAIPGMGTHFVNACLNQDIPLVLGTTVVYTVLVVMFNLMVDIAYAWVDPRISLGSR